MPITDGFILRRFLYILTLLALLGTLLIAAESKLEADLRAKLAASEAARATALKEKADLVTVLGRLSKTNDAVKAVAQTASQSAGIAQKDAGLAQDSATSLALITQQAALAASTAALVAQQQAHTFNSNSLAMIGVQVLVLLGLLAGFANGAMRENRRHNWTVQEAAITAAMATKTQETMSALEKNTNSIKDAQIKETDEKAYAEGVKNGAKEGPEATRSNTNV